MARALHLTRATTSQHSDTASTRSAAGPPSSSSTPPTPAAGTGTAPAFGPPPGSPAARLFEAAESLPPPSAGGGAGVGGGGGRSGAAASAHSAPPLPAPTPGGAAARFLLRTAAAAALGTAAAAAYYTAAYTVDQTEARAAELRAPGNPPVVALAGAALAWWADKRKDAEAAVAKYADPPSDRLLPDLPPSARHVRTLVLDLDDVLIHSAWTRRTGWRTFKRPGVDDFLKGAAQFYEVVVYTSQLPTYADPILDRLDPHRCIQYRLYRDSTQYVGGVHARDLAKLNRDPSRVLFVTAEGVVAAAGAGGGGGAVAPATATATATTAAAAAGAAAPAAAPSGGGGGDASAPPPAVSGTLQPENAVHVKPWAPASPADADAAVGDTALLDLLPFLEAIFRADVPDTRAVVRAYAGCGDVGSAFRERMKAKSIKAGGGGGGGGGGGPGGAGFRLFGGGR